MPLTLPRYAVEAVESLGIALIEATFFPRLNFPGAWLAVPFGIFLGMHAIRLVFARVYGDTRLLSSEPVVFASPATYRRKLRWILPWRAAMLVVIAAAVALRLPVTPAYLLVEMALGLLLVPEDAVAASSRVVVDHRRSDPPSSPRR